MPYLSRAGGEDGVAAPLPWLSLNADRRGIPDNTPKPSLTVSDAATHLTRAGLSWSALGESAVVSFAFRATSGPLPLDVSGFARFTATQIQATLLALQAWSDVAGITFVRQDDGGGYSDNAAILFGGYSSGADGAAAFASLPGSTASSSAAGDVWVNSSLSYNAAPTMGGFGQLTLVHEIGHAIGLLHPGDYDAAPGVEITYRAHASYYEDSNQYTVMSYFGETATGAAFGTGRYVSAPMLDDIAAAQRLYGANYQTRTGDTVYGFNSTADRPWFSVTAGGPIPVFAVWDAGGTDTLDFSGISSFQLIDLRQGSFSNVGGFGNVSIAVGAVIENAIAGAGDDQIYGNSSDNRITPGGGRDRIDGGLGADTVVLPGPRSAYTLTWTTTDLFISGPDGTTHVRNVEYLAFSDVTIEVVIERGLIVVGDITDEVAHGTDFSDRLSGSDGDDQIYGHGEHDQIIGGRGDDLIDAGAGNDLIYIDEGDDTIIGGEGTDILDLSGALTGVVLDLQAGLMTGAWSGVDQISSIERIVGSRLNDHITGDLADNYIQAYGGIDVIHGGGGNDEIIGSWMEVGGAEDLLKAESQANGSLATAVSLDQSFDKLPRDGTVGFGQPHATVVATTHGGYEYYAFTTVNSNTDVNFDIDGASFDTVIRVFDANGVELARNDDGTYDRDGGSPRDSYLNFRVATPGVYYLQVSAYSAGSGETVQSVPPPAGESYTLHVTVPGHATQPTYAQGSELFGDDGNDILRGTDAGEMLDGGSGDDVIYAMRGSDVIRGGEGWDTLHLIWDTASQSRLLMVGEDEYILKGPEGADRISGVEIIRFAGASIDLARMYSQGAFDGRSDGISLSELAARSRDGDAPLVLPAIRDIKSLDPTEDPGPEVLPGETSLPSADPYLDLTAGHEIPPQVWPETPDEHGQAARIHNPFQRDPAADSDRPDLGDRFWAGGERVWDYLE